MPVYADMRYTTVHDNTLVGGWVGLTTGTEPDTLPAALPFFDQEQSSACHAVRHEHAAAGAIHMIVHAHARVRARISHRAIAHLSVLLQKRTKPCKS